MPILVKRILRREQELGPGKQLIGITPKFRKIELIATESGAVQRHKAPLPDEPIQPDTKIHLLFGRVARVVSLPKNTRAELPTYDAAT